MLHNIRISLSIKYSSEFYKKELEKYSQPEKYTTKTAVYQIDSNKGVMMDFQKKYRFESILPFQVSDKLFRTDVTIALSYG